MVERFDCSPQFVNSMFGEPDYWAPGDFALHDQHGSNKSLSELIVMFAVFDMLTSRICRFLLPTASLADS